MGGAWADVTFVRRDIDALERALVPALERFGRRRVAPSTRPKDRWAPMQYGTGVTAQVWAHGIAEGLHGWSIVTSAPRRLLAEPDADGVPRLVALAKELASDVLHVSVEDGIAALIVEARANGEWAISGYTMEGLSFSGIPLDEARAMPRIDLVDVPDAARTAFEGRFEDALGILAATLGGGAQGAEHEIRQALVEGRVIDGVRVIELGRAQAAPAPRAPLEVDLELEPADGGTRWRFRAGVGEMWLGGMIDAPDARRGAAFAAVVADWLGVRPRSSVASVPSPAYASCREISAPPAPGTRMLSIGDRDPVWLRVRPNEERTRAAFEEDDPALREKVVEKLHDALAGVVTADSPLVPTLESLLDEPTARALGTFAGEAAVVAWWSAEQTKFRPEGAEVLEEEGLVTALTGIGPGRVVAALVTPKRHGASRGYGQDDPTRIVVIDLARGTTRTLLESGHGITCGFTRLVVSPDLSEVAIAIERGRGERRTRIVPLDADGERELAGTLVGWDARGLAFERLQPAFRSDLIRSDGSLATLVSPDGRFEVVAEQAGLVVRDRDRERRIDGPWHGVFPRAFSWVGPHALLVGSAPDVLDLETLEQRPLFGAEGLRFEACSPSFRRVLANVDARRIWLGGLG